ncbi:hypothetical protein LXL04_014921 [Taraxacum kok-saghyz]
MNGFKKGRTSSPECKFEQGSEAKQCSKCNRYRDGECTIHQRTCYKCGKTGHLSPDCKVGKVCFGCGSPDHIRSNCPQNRSNNQGKIADKDNHPADKKAETYKPKVRSYNMTTHEARDTLEKSSGMPTEIVRNGRETNAKSEYKGGEEGLNLEDEEIPRRRNTPRSRVERLHRRNKGGDNGVIGGQNDFVPDDDTGYVGDRNVRVGVVELDTVDNGGIKEEAHDIDGDF